jgi:transcriptional regulator with XRE-family HTH domain
VSDETQVKESHDSSFSRQGLSLADIHAKTGIGRAAICRLENLVDANPTVATLDRMAAALLNVRGETQTMAMARLWQAKPVHPPRETRHASRLHPARQA